MINLLMLHNFKNFNWSYVCFSYEKYTNDCVRRFKSFKTLPPLPPKKKQTHTQTNTAILYTCPKSGTFKEGYCVLAFKFCGIQQNMLFETKVSFYIFLKKYF